MIYLLQRIHRQLRLFITDHSAISHQSKQDWQLLEMDLNEINNELLINISNAVSNEQATLIIRSATIAATYLFNDLFSNRQIISKVLSYKHYHAAASILASFFLHLQQSHEKFNYCMPVPLYFSELLKQEINKEEATFYDTLFWLTKDERLTQLVSYTVKSYSNENTNITWHQWLWLRRLIRQVYKLNRKNNTISGACLLSKWLVINGFNKPVFIEYVYRYIKQSTTSIESVEEQIVCWQKWAAKLNNLACYATSSFYENRPTFITAINSKISAEHTFLKSKLINKSATLVPVHINTDLSVAQPAVLLKLLCDAGIIRYNNQKELIALITTVFKTNKSLSISQESLRNKYYSPELVAITIVKEHLLSMLKSLK